MTNKGITIDKDALAAAMKEKGYTIASLADAVGVGKESIRQYVTMGGRSASLPVYRMICNLLEVSEDDIKKKPNQPKTAVTKAIETSETMDAIAALSAKIDSLSAKFDAMNEDLGKLAKLILDASKTAAEAKGQAELNRDEISAIYNKTTECNSTVNKILGNQKCKRY